MEEKIIYTIQFRLKIFEEQVVISIHPIRHWEDADSIAFGAIKMWCENNKKHLPLTVSNIQILGTIYKWDRMKIN